MKYIKWLWHRAGDAKGSVTWNILLACISIGLNLFFIWLSKSLVDIATGARTGSTLKLFAAILVATMLVRVFVSQQTVYRRGCRFQSYLPGFAGIDNNHYPTRGSVRLPLYDGCETRYHSAAYNTSIRGLRKDILQTHAKTHEGYP